MCRESLVQRDWTHVGILRVLWNWILQLLVANGTLVIIFVDPFILSQPWMERLVLLEPVAGHLSPALAMRFSKKFAGPFKNIRFLLTILLLAIRVVSIGTLFFEEIGNIPEMVAFNLVSPKLLSHQHPASFFYLFFLGFEIKIKLHLQSFFGQIYVEILNLSVTVPLLKNSLVEITKFDKILLLHVFADEVAEPKYFSLISIDRRLQLHISLKRPPHRRLRVYFLFEFWKPNRL